MKNSRILSLLLAAVMTSTSLPLVTGVSAAAPATSLETGELAGANKSYGEANIVTPKVQGNGYITLAKLPWILSGNAATVNLHRLYLDINHTIEAGKTYCVRYDVRMHSLASNNGQYISTDIPRASSGDNGFYIEAGTAKVDDALWQTWQEVTKSSTDVNVGQQLQIAIRRRTHSNNGHQHTGPIDIDNLTVWIDNDGVTDENGNLVYNADVDTKLYAENFDDPNGDYLGTGAGKLYNKSSNSNADAIGDFTLYHNFDEKWGEVEIPANNTSALLTYSGLNFEPGWYTFSADFEIPYHFVGNIVKDQTFNNLEEAQSAYKKNDHDVKFEFTLASSDGEETVEVIKTDAISSAWNKVETTFKVPEGHKLTEIKVIPTIDTNLTVPAPYNKLRFKNVDLELLSPFSNIVDAEAENFLDKATESYGDSYYTETEGSDNGYIYVDTRTWSYNASDVNYWGVGGYPIWKLTTTESVDTSATYYIQYDARSSVPTNSDQAYLTKVFSSETNPTVGARGTYGGKGVNSTYYANISGEGKSGDFSMFIRQHDGAATTHSRDNIPMVFDNITVWKEYTGGNGTFGEEDSANIVYSSDFNDPNASLTEFSGAVGIDHIFDEKYATLTPEDATTGTPILTYKNLNNGAGHSEGVYTFKADLRVPYFYYKNLVTEVGGLDNESDKDSVIAAWNANNDHTVDVVFTMEHIDGGEPITTTLKETIDYNWSNLETTVIVEEGYKLTSIEVKTTINENVPADYRKLDFKNVILCKADLPVISDEGTGNYLDGIKPKYENTVPTEVTIDDPNGYVYVGELNPTNNVSTMLSITTGAKVTKDTEYVIECDIIGYPGEYAKTIGIRPRLNIATTAPDTNPNNNDHYSSYLIPYEGNDFNTRTAGGSSVVFQSSALNKTLAFKALFKAGVDNNNLIVNFIRPDSPSLYAPYSIDNFRIYELGTGIEIYSNEFDAEEDFTAIVASSTSTGTYTVDRILPINHTLYTPDDNTQPMKITYNLGLTPDEAVEGRYSFKTMVKLAEKTDKAAKARVIFNYSDGTSDINYIDLTKDWSYIGKSGWLDTYPDLVSITIEFDSDVPVMLISPELNIFYKYTYGKPNAGIVMVLLKKMQGKMSDPWKQIGLDD